MAKALKNQDNSESSVPRWRIVACTKPTIFSDGGATVRGMNDLGHAIDLYFPPTLFDWVSTHNPESASLCDLTVPMGGE